MLKKALYISSMNKKICLTAIDDLSMSSQFDIVAKNAKCDI